MKKTITVLALFSFAATATHAQEATTLMAQALKYEQQLKDTSALGKYAVALQIQPSNMAAAIKCAEMCCAIGARQTNPDEKRKFYTDAKNFAYIAIKLDSNNADANYINAVAYGKLTEIETKNDKIVEAVKFIKLYADKAIALNPNLGKAWYVVGKWHFEVNNLSSLKKTAVKLFYGGLPTANIDSAINDFEKCRTLEPYFCRNYLALAKAYYQNKQYEKALVALQQCIKSPTLQIDDKAVKEEAKQLLVQWQ